MREFPLLHLVVCCVLYSCSVLCLLLMSQYKIDHNVRIFNTQSLRLGLLATCTVMCSTAWRFWYVAIGENQTNWAVALGTFGLITTPIAWVYFKRKQNEDRRPWLVTKQR